MLNFNNFIQFSTILIVGGLGFFSCIGEERDCKEKPAITNVDNALLEAQIQSIEQYLDTTYNDYIVDASGVRVVVLEEGRGAFPDLCSTVDVDYAGTVLGEDKTFETAIGSTFVLTRGTLITGWYYGLFNMKASGEYIMFIPGELAYGSDTLKNLNDDVIIAPNSNLKFRIRVNDVRGN